MSSDEQRTRYATPTTLDTTARHTSSTSTTTLHAGYPTDIQGRVRDLKDNTIILLVGAVLLTVIAIIAPEQRQYVVGALAGLLAGHLNGQQRQQQQVNGEGVAKSLYGPGPVLRVGDCTRRKT